jgi:segregation and condensation protein B
MSESYVRNVIEAALLAAGAPLPVAELTRLFDDSARPSAQQVRAALAALAAEYSGRGIELKETASGFRIQVRRELAAEISRLWPERAPRYSRALLETLALIAYRQPITRAEIEAVRGVAVNPNIIRTVIERNWVRVVGHRDVPGRPELLGTTREFLDYFSLKSLDELPPLAEVRAMGDINLQLGLADEGALAAGEDAAAAAPAPAAQSEAGTDTADSDESLEDDELSAEGGSTRELVAGARDLDG